MGLPIVNINANEAVEAFERMIVPGSSHQVCSMNLDTWLNALADPHAHRIMAGFNMILPNGRPLKWASGASSAVHCPSVFPRQTSSSVLPISQRKRATRFFCSVPRPASLPASLSYWSGGILACRSSERTHLSKEIRTRWIAPKFSSGFMPPSPTSCSSTLAMQNRKSGSGCTKNAWAFHSQWASQAALTFSQAKFRALPAGFNISACGGRRALRSSPRDLACAPCATSSLC